MRIDGVESRILYVYFLSCYSIYIEVITIIEIYVLCDFNIFYSSFFICTIPNQAKILKTSSYNKHTAPNTNQTMKININVFSKILLLPPPLLLPPLPPFLC